MTRRSLCLLAALIGLVAPYYFLISFIANYGLAPGQFVAQLFGTPISAFFAIDLAISSIVFIIFLWTESSRLNMKHRWIYLLALFTVGLSFALPLFLWSRESHLEQLTSGAR